MSVYKRLRQVAQHACLHAPAIRALFEKVELNPADLRGPEDLARLPVTGKESVTELQQRNPPLGGLLGVPINRVVRLFMSPGPIYEPQGAGEDCWRWGPALDAAGFGPGDVAQNTFAYHLTPAGFMFDAALRRLGATVVPAGVGNNELQVRLMHDLGVTGFVGVPSYLMALIQKSKEMGYRFPEDFRLKKGFVTGEKLPASLRHSLQEDYGVKMFQGYGTAELGCIAYECERQDGLHLDEGGTIVEIVNPETGRPLGPGEVGEVVVTLLDETYPLFRLGTGDLSIYIDKPCACGRVTKRLAGLVGRVGDAVKVRGMFVHPSQVKELLSQFPEISRFQGVITRMDHRDEITFNLEAGDAGEGFAAKVAARLQEVLRLKSVVNLVSPGAIPANAPEISDERIWD